MKLHRLLQGDLHRKRTTLRVLVVPSTLPQSRNTRKTSSDIFLPIRPNNRVEGASRHRLRRRVTAGPGSKCAARYNPKTRLMRAGTAPNLAYFSIHLPEALRILEIEGTWTTETATGFLEVTH